MPQPRQHPLVERFARATSPPGSPPESGVAESVLAGIPPAPALPDSVTFVGFVSGTIVSPATANGWLLLYRDWRMTTWLLVEGIGILHVDTVPEDGAAERARNIVWVTRDTAVGRGSGPQSDEARFLTGEFARAGDFDTSWTGGPSDPNTGAFCPSTPLCGCTKRSRY